MSDLLRDIGARVRSALFPLAGGFLYRTTTSFNVKAGEAVESGSIALTVTGLPEGFAGIAEGDVLSLTTPRAFTAATPAVGGVITAAPLDGPIVVRIAAGTSLTIRRSADAPCTGWWEDAEQRIAVGLTLVTGTAVINLLADSLPSPPVVDARLIAGDRVWTIKSVSSDPTGAVWRCVCA